MATSDVKKLKTITHYITSLFPRGTGGGMPPAVSFVEIPMRAVCIPER